jgi:hypothetical protein
LILRFWLMLLGDAAVDVIDKLFQAVMQLFPRGRLG